MVFLLNSVSCLKWQLFLKEYGNKVSFFRLLSLYCIGKFLDNFFPSTLGGDIARSYLLGKQINSQGRSFASVALERITGLFAMVILALFFAALNPNLLQEPIIVTSFICVGVVAVILTILFIFPFLIEKVINLFMGFVLFRNILKKVQIIVKEILFFRGKTSLLTMTMGYSFFFHCLAIVQVYLACRTIGFSPYFLDVAVITPIVLMITSIPSTPNKLGVWEWAFGVYLLQAGGNVAEGVAVALLLRGLGLSVSFIGGILFFIEKNTKDDSSYKKSETKIARK